MEVSVEEEVAIRRFLQEFNKECRLSPTGDDGIQLRGGIVSSYRLLPEDVLPEVRDWVLYYMEQRKSPHALADYLARHVAERISKAFMSNRHSNGTKEGSDKETLIDSLQLYTDVMEHLHELCNHLRDSDDYHDLLTEANLFRISYPVSVCGIKNTRRRMEDRHVVIHDLGATCHVEDEMHSSYYAVFDGHGGVDAANYAASHLHWNIVQHPLYIMDLSTAMKEAFKTTDEDFLCRYSRDGIKSGCTAICCIVRNHILYMAWVGDSQAIIVRQGVPILCMEIHKPERQDERQRIEEMGGSVTYQDGWRVNNAVGVSRAIGDPEYKKWISSDADVCTIPLNGTEDFLVVACDGLWDAMSPSDVTAVVYHQIMERPNDIEGVATELVHHAKDQGSRDNISGIIVFLRDPASLAKQAMSPNLSDAALNFEQMKQHNGSYQYLESNGMQYFGDLADKSENLTKRLESDYFEESYSNPFASSSAAVGGSVPERTAYSELPTPPIEDVLLSDEFMIHNARDSSSETFLGADQRKTTEIASGIVNAAIEAAVEICASGSESGPEVAANQATSVDDFAQVPTSDIKENTKRLLENCDIQQPFVDNKEITMENMMEVTDVDESYKAMFTYEAIPFLQDGKANQAISEDGFVQVPTSDIEENTASLLEKGDIQQPLVNDIEITMENMMEITDVDAVDSCKAIEEQNTMFTNQVNPFLQDGKAQRANPFSHDSKTQQANPFSHDSEVQHVPLDFTKPAKDPIPEHDSQTFVQSATSHQMSAFGAGDFEKYDSGMMFRQEQQNLPGHFESSIQSSQSELFYSSQTNFMQAQGSSPFGISELASKDFPSTMLEENPFLSGPDSLLLYGGLNLGNVEQSTGNNLFSLSEEAPSAVRSLQGVPEMLGISESVPGRKSPEVVSCEKTTFGITNSMPGDMDTTKTDAPSARSPFDGMEKLPDDSFLDASLDNLRSLGTEQGTGDQTLLGMKSLSTMMEAMALQEEIGYSQPAKQDEPRVDEHFSFLDELSKPDIKENIDPVQQQKVEAYFPSLPEVRKEMVEEQVVVPEVQTENIVEQVMEQIQVGNTSSETGETESLNAKELVSEVIAKVLSEEAPPTPAVLVDNIPEFVPEADGVTEDSDSEKDGGWKYVSGTKQPKKDSKKPPESKATAAPEVQPAQKEARPQTDTVKRVKAPSSSTTNTTRKPLASKPSTEAKVSATQKQATSAQTTIRKAPTPSSTKTITQMKPTATKTSSLASRTLKVAVTTKTTVTARPTTAPSDATKPAASRMTGSATTRPKLAATSTTSTMQKPTSTVARKSKPVGTNDVAAKLPSSTTSTLQPRRPSPATATTTTTTTAKTVVTKTSSSTLPGARIQPRKPVPNGEAVQTKTKMDKAIASNTMRPSRPLASAKAPASITQAKETKETVNKEISKMPSPLKAKPVSSSTLPNTRRLPQNGVKSSLAKPPTPTSPPKKQVSPIKKSGTLGKDVVPPKNSPSKSPQKIVKKASPSTDPTSENKTEKEKGSLEENTKETKATDSGLASPATPVSPQLLDIELAKENIEAGQCANEQIVEHPELIQQ